MTGYWYIEGADGRHFCWSKELSVTCPVGSKEELGDVLAAACSVVGIDPAYMLRRLKHNGYRKRVDGRLTDRCETCNHKLERLGYRCWIERPYTDEELQASGDLRATVRLNQALGSAGMKTVKVFYVDTKREAQQWAREEAALARKIKEEETANAQ